MASRLCSEIGTSHGRATWREDPGGSPLRCGLIVGWYGVDLCREAFHGSRAAMTTPTQSGRASGSASGDANRPLRFYFRGSPLRQWSKIAQGIRGRTTSISSPPDKGARIRSPLIPLAVTSHCMNSSAAYEYAEPSGVTPSVFGNPSRSAQVEDPGAWPGRRERVEVQRQLHLVDRESDRRRR